MGGPKWRTGGQTERLIRYFYILKAERSTFTHIIVNHFDNDLDRPVILTYQTNPMLRNIADRLKLKPVLHNSAYFVAFSTHMS